MNMEKMLSRLRSMSKLRSAAQETQPSVTGNQPPVSGNQSPAAYSPSKEDILSTLDGFGEKIQGFVVFGYFHVQVQDFVTIYFSAAHFIYFLLLEILKKMCMLHFLQYKIWNTLAGAYLWQEILW